MEYTPLEHKSPSDVLDDYLDSIYNLSDEVTHLLTELRLADERFKNIYNEYEEARKAYLARAESIFDELDDLKCIALRNTVQQTYHDAMKAQDRKIEISEHLETLVERHLSRLDEELARNNIDISSDNERHRDSDDDDDDNNDSDDDFFTKIWIAYPTQFPHPEKRSDNGRKIVSQAPPTPTQLATPLTTPETTPTTPAPKRRKRSTTSGTLERTPERSSDPPPPPPPPPGRRTPRSTRNRKIRDEMMEYYI